MIERFEILKELRQFYRKQEIDRMMKSYPTSGLKELLVMRRTQQLRSKKITKNPLSGIDSRN